MESWPGGIPRLTARESRIVETTQYCDLFTLMNQIGALPTTASP